MTTIYVSAVGQEDNIGDSILRRAYLDTLRTAGPLHVLVPDDDRYISGLGLCAQDVSYRSRDRWRGAVIRAAARGDIAFALNAGEATLDADYAKYCGRVAAIAAVAKLRRSKIVIAGSGFRPGFSGGAPWSVRTLARRGAFVSWRDAETQQAAGAGTVAPDWAFGLGRNSGLLRSPRHGAERDLLVISLRAAGPAPSRSRGAEIGALAASLDLEPVVLVQVARDNEIAQHTAQDNGFRCLPWLDGDHAEREELVRSVYARSRLVISNRVHALILGITEGAVPVAPAEWGSVKSERIFRAAGIGGVTAAASSPLYIPPANGADDTCFSELDGARLRLRRAARQLVDALAAPDGTPQPGRRRPGTTASPADRAKEAADADTAVRRARENSPAEGRST